MSHARSELAHRILSELEQIRRICERAIEGWRRAQVSNDDYYIDGVALGLHSFYSGIERVLELIAIEIDNKRPTGEAWHRSLLQQMTAEVPGVRPAALSNVSSVLLDQYRGFRHVVRNIYAYNFDPAKVGQLVRDLPQTADAVIAELAAFARFLQVDRN
jgi:hypothetical protein